MHALFIFCLSVFYDVHPSPAPTSRRTRGGTSNTARHRPTQPCIYRPVKDRHNHVYFDQFKTDTSKYISTNSITTQPCIYRPIRDRHKHVYIDQIECKTDTTMYIIIDKILWPNLILRGSLFTSSSTP